VMSFGKVVGAVIVGNLAILAVTMVLGLVLPIPGRTEVK